MHSSRLLLSAATASLLACGGTVETSGGTGGTTTTSSSTTSTTTTSTTGSGGCAGYIDVTIDGIDQQFASSCYGAWGANESDGPAAYLFSGGPFPGAQALDVVGCVGSAQGEEGVLLSASDASGTGTFTAGSTSYTDASGGLWGAAGDPFELVVTSFGEVGDYVEGSFQVMVTHGGNAAHTLTATFAVCRVSDLLAP